MTAMNFKLINSLRFRTSYNWSVSDANSTDIELTNKYNIIYAKQHSENLINAQKNENQADELEEKIEKYLFEVLGVQILKKIEPKLSLQTIDLKDLSRWDYDYAIYKKGGIFSVLKDTSYHEITSKQLKDLQIPIPPKEIQTQIVNHITTQKEQIKNLRQQAEKLRKQAKENFEKEIFVTT
jgi:restriction endonuclease S subunit